MIKTHTQIKQRHATLIEAAKVETRPLHEWCEDIGFSESYAAAILRRHRVPFKRRIEGKEDKMRAMLEKGMDCAAIAAEMGMANQYYVYYRLKKMGANPPRPIPVGNKHEIGGKRMSREIPRLVKMMGDLKRGMDTGWMREKYGICRERVSQIRAYGIETGLLP